MIHILRGSHGPSDRSLLSSMFEDRKRLFVDLLRWQVPVVDGRFEMDQFDGPDAIYLVSVDATGQHDGSLRLLPTDRPHLLDSLFGYLCDGVVPVGPDVYEITRLCLPARHNTTERLHIRNQLISAMVDHALGAGIRMLTGVVEARFREQILTMGWRAEPLGPAHLVGASRIGAFAIAVDEQTPALLATTGIYAPVAIRETCHG